MRDNTVNGKKIGKSAGKDDNTLLTVIDVAEKKKEIEKTSKKIFAELENEWDLEAKGKTHRSVMQALHKKEDFLVFKTKDHIAYVENGIVTKREVIQKDAKRSVQQEETEK